MHLRSGVPCPRTPVHGHGLHMIIAYAFSFAEINWTFRGSIYSGVRQNTNRHNTIREEQLQQQL